MAAARCPSNCRPCRSSTARGALPAIGVSASAAISRGWRGWPPCAAMNSLVEHSDRATPDPRAPVIAQAGPATDSLSAGLSARESFVQDPSAAGAPHEKPSRENLTSEDPAVADFVIETGVALPTELPEPIAHLPSHPTDLDNAVEPPQDILKEVLKEIPTEEPETPKNVLPFRPPGDAKPPSLTPVENSAFNELARQLSARLETEMVSEPAPAVTGIDETDVEKATSADAGAADMDEAAGELPSIPKPEWLAPPTPQPAP